MNSFLGSNSEQLDKMSLSSDTIGLHGYPKTTKEAKEIHDLVLRFRTTFEDAIADACTEVDTSTFMAMTIAEDMSTLSWEDGALLLGFVNAQEIPGKTVITTKLQQVARIIQVSEEVQAYEDLTAERVEKLLRLSFRTGLEEARENKFIEIKKGKRIHFNKVLDSFNRSIERLFDPDDVEDWDEILRNKATELRDEDDPDEEIEEYLDEAQEILLHDEGEIPPEPDINRGYNHFIRKAFQVDHNRVTVIQEELDEAVTEAVDLFNRLFQDTEHLHAWLLEHYPDKIELHQGFRSDSYSEYRRFNYYQMLWVALKSEIRLNGQEGQAVNAMDTYIAQSIAYLAYFIYWLKTDRGFSLSRDNRINQNIEGIIDKEFWRHATEPQEKEFTYYTSPDQTRISETWSHETPVKKIVKAPRKVVKNYCEEGDFPEDLNLQIWRNETEPKTLISTLLKVASEQKPVNKIPDHQRSEAIVNISMNDLDLSESKNPDRAKRIHNGLKHLASEHGKALGLNEAPENIHYTEIPAGTFKVVNKAKWNSDKGPPKSAFIAIKVYSAVPVDSEGNVIRNYTPEKHPNALIIRREFRLAPYDVWHASNNARRSTIAHNPYKWYQSVRLLLKVHPRSEFPREMHLFKVMSELFEEKAAGDKCHLYRVPLPKED